MYHFIGIKGSGMSALAQIMHQLNIQVQGSDVDKSFFTDIGLKEKGIKFFVYNANNINETMKIVLGNSVREDNVELIKARELGLEIYSYQEMVGNLSKQYKTIAVSGCHGKTTTTSMLAHTLDNTVGCNYLIGDGNGNANASNELFALEACEYQRHFLAYYPKYLIITNIDLDHVDYFKDIDDVIDAYQTLALKAEAVIACGEDMYTKNINHSNILFYGTADNNDVIAKNIEYTTSGTIFDVYIRNSFYANFTIPFGGLHNLLNALSVISICYLENIDVISVKLQLESVPGAKRRFNETIINNCIIVDDYAHHPTEIAATINAARQKYPNKELVAVFQPHTYSRTAEFIDEYAEVLKKCDKSFVMDLHPARENKRDYPGISSQLIVDKLENCDLINMDEADKLKEYTNAVILFMGANDLSKIENDFKKIVEC